MRGFEGIYEVSKSGVVRRIAYRFGKKTRILKPYNNYGYKVVSLIDGPRALRTKVHRIVIEAFLGPIPNGMHTNHKNGIRHDNRLSNLEVVTPGENVRHGVRMKFRVPRNIRFSSYRDIEGKLRGNMVFSSQAQQLCKLKARQSFRQWVARVNLNPVAMFGKWAVYYRPDVEKLARVIERFRERQAAKSIS